MAFEELIQQIDAQEAWLAGVEVEVPVPKGTLDQAKRQVRLAIDDTWLAEHSVTEPPPGVLSAVKRVVAEELAAAAEGPTWLAAGIEAKRIYRLATSISAAAALLLAAGLGIWSALTAPDHPRSSFRLADLAEVMSRQPDEDETEWNAIEAELTDLESALARGGFPSWDRAMLDDLDEQIDELMSDVDQWPEGAKGAG